MQKLAKWTSILFMLVVICFTTTSQSFVSEQGDSCCQHEENSNSSCSDTEDKGCKNEGNPFQSCSCCVHAWMPPRSVAFEAASYPAITIFFLDGKESLPPVTSSDFWQPPRFS